MTKEEKTIKFYYDHEESFDIFCEIFEIKGSDRNIVCDWYYYQYYEKMKNWLLENKLEIVKKVTKWQCL